MLATVKVLAVMVRRTRESRSSSKLTGRDDSLIDTQDHCGMHRPVTSPRDPTMYRVALCLVLIASTLAIPRPATAAVTEFYETVDFVEVDKRNCSLGCLPSLTIRGVLVGGGAPITRTYTFANGGNGTEGVDTALQCQRLAVLVMSKPGKFQLGVGPLPGASGCRLTLVTP
jgi:hypothetical protein